MATVRWDEMEAAIAANTQKHVGIGGGAVTRSVSSLPTEVGLSWLPGWCEDTLTLTDGVALSLWIRDPLYRVATPSLRRSMEMEEAQYLIHQTEVMPKGRSWVRKHLEEDLRLRACGGAPAPDAWEISMKVRRAALLLDYIFTMRDLRVVLWWPNHKAVSVIPMTGSNTVTQINCLTGRVLVKSGSTISWPAWQQLMLTAADDIVWIPPASAPSGGSLTVAQIQDRIKAIGGQVTGNRQVLWNRLMWLTATITTEVIQEVSTVVTVATGASTNMSYNDESIIKVDFNSSP